jgi:hypothetical protein
MSALAFTVISTGFAVPADARRKCIESVRSQFRPPLGPAYDHVYIDAAEHPGGPKAHFENLTEAVSKLPDDRIVACVDGDDWLGPPSALVTVARYFAAGAWVTYGSFQFADGRRGVPSDPYLPGEDIRRAPWKATHLKCFKAGLFKKIKHEHLKLPNGEWIPYARDLALMFPLLEMAGPKRTAHIPTLLYIYNWGNSTEFKGDAEFRRAEAECVKYVRGLPPYAVLP